MKFKLRSSILALALAVATGSGSFTPLLAESRGGISEPGSSMIDNVLYQLLENGMSSVTFYDENAKMLRAQVNVTKQAMEEAKGYLCLLINPVDPMSLSNAADITVTMEQSGFVLIPVEGVDESTVAVFNENGNWRIDPRTIETGQGIVIYLETGTHQIRIVNNAIHFADPSDQAWINEAINYVSARGIMNAMQNNKFLPDETVSRGMFVQMLYNLFERPAVSGSGLSDLSPNAYYYDAAIWALQNGIVQGNGTGANRTFNGESFLSREQLALIIYRFCGEPAVSTTLSGYADSDEVSDWAREGMAFCVQEGLMGKDTIYLNPLANLKRYELAAIIMRLLQSSPELLNL